MKKSILTLAVLAAVCPAAFAADADTIKTIVWNTTTDPVLTNLTFDYTGAQLKAGSNGKSYFDVVDVMKTKASLLQTSAHPLLRSTATCPFLVRASSFSRTTRK